ncbi:5449_t:CDS:2, partial [Funneliformis mosseae]
EEMVEISMKAMSEFRGEVNDFLREDNGSPYLKMVYEEVLFLVGKKVMDESIRLDNDNTRTLHQIVKDVLKETINDISQIDLNGV